MKTNLLLLLAGLFVFASCNKDKGMLSPDAKVYLNGIKSDSKAYTQPGDGILGTNIDDSIHFVAAYAFRINFTSTDGKNIHWQGKGFMALNEEDYNKCHDLVNNRLIYSGEDVIRAGDLGYFIRNCKDAIIVAETYKANGNAIHPIDYDSVYNSFPEGIIPLTVDTIAYIPNSVLLKAQKEIIDAYNREDFEACYRLFDEAFVFVPITGERWRALKAAGIE